MGILFVARSASILLSLFYINQMLLYYELILPLDMSILDIGGGELLETKGAFYPRFTGWNLGSGIDDADFRSLDFLIELMNQHLAELNTHINCFGNLWYKLGRG